MKLAASCRNRRYATAERVTQSVGGSCCRALSTDVGCGSSVGQKIPCWLSDCCLPSLYPGRRLDEGGASVDDVLAELGACGATASLLCNGPSAAHVSLRLSLQDCRGQLHAATEPSLRADTPPSPSVISSTAEVRMYSSSVNESTWIASSRAVSALLRRSASFLLMTPA